MPGRALQSGVNQAPLSPQARVGAGAGAAVVAAVVLNPLDVIKVCEVH